MSYVIATILVFTFPIWLALLVICASKLIKKTKYRRKNKKNLRNNYE